MATIIHLHRLRTASPSDGSGGLLELSRNRLPRSPKLGCHKPCLPWLCYRPLTPLIVSFAGAFHETQAGSVSHSPTARLQLSSKVTLGGLQELGSQVRPSPAPVHETMPDSTTQPRAQFNRDCQQDIWGIPIVWGIWGSN